MLLGEAAGASHTGTRRPGARRPACLAVRRRRPVQGTPTWRSRMAHTLSAPLDMDPDEDGDELVEMSCHTPPHLQTPTGAADHTAGLHVGAADPPLPLPPTPASLAPEPEPELGLAPASLPAWAMAFSDSDDDGGGAEGQIGMFAGATVGERGDDDDDDDDDDDEEEEEEPECHICRLTANDMVPSISPILCSAPAVLPPCWCWAVHPLTTKRACRASGW
jgi:hypothetical protein